MPKKKSSSILLSVSLSDIQPGFAVNCVILGFHNGSLKVLLNHVKDFGQWMLPGGYIFRNENADDAACRVAKFRTGLERVFLRQFHLFGNAERNNISENEIILQRLGVDATDNHWFLQRFIGLGYYALVKYDDVQIGKSLDEDEVKWFNLKDVPSLYADHNEIIQKAIETLRQQIGFVPVGYELLPEKFTMPELRTIYEILIGKELDRRNFQRKMLSVGLIKKLNETRKVGAHKSPNLYSFDEEKYNEATQFGLKFMNWSF